MTNEILIAQEYDGLTGETSTRPLNSDELAELAELAAGTATRETEREALAKARTSALAKLKKLGLTDKEIAAL
jgi:hypothetical protein